MATTLSTNQFSYSKQTNTFVAELSELNCQVNKKSIQLINPKTNNLKVFNFYKTDTDGEDVFGFRYKTSCGIELLIIND